MAIILPYVSKHSWLRPLGLSLFILLPGKLIAQTDTTAKKLKEVKVISATVPVLQTIIPSQTISATDFERYGAFTVADAIRDFSGVILKDYGGLGGLKTVSVRGLSANHTAVLYDGVELNDAENGQVDLSKLNLNNVQQITLYNGQPPGICMPARSFASASVLSVKTVRPDLTPAKPYQVIAGLKAGSFGFVNPYLQWQQRISKNWSSIVNSYLENAADRYKFHTLNSEGKDSVATRRNSAISAQQADGALYWAKSDSNTFNLHVNYYNSDRGLPGAVIIYNTTASKDRLWDRDFFIQAGYERLWKSSLHLLLNTKVTQSYLRYQEPGYLNAAGILDQHFTQREFYQSAALSYHIIQNWEVSYAADLSINDLNADLFNFAYPTRVTLLNVLASNFSIGKLQLQGNLLNTNVTETVKTGRVAPAQNIYSPTLMATLQPFAGSNFQLRAYYKNIFRNPTFDELYYSGVGNPNLKPEHTNQYDIGITYLKNLAGFFDYITVTADAYYNEVTNKIVFIPKDTYNGSVQNFGKAQIEGIDAGLKTQVKLAENWKGKLSVNYSYQHAINVTDLTLSTYLNQLPYTPKNTLALNAGIDHGPVGLYYNQVISSSRYYTNDNLPSDYIPGYSASDASLVYHFTAKTKPVTASFEVNNLFNKNYVVVQSYPMPGRSLGISFQITI